jgi:hypothetical protein
MSMSRSSLSIRHLAECRVNSYALPSWIAQWTAVLCGHTEADSVERRCDGLWSWCRKEDEPNLEEMTESAG